MVGEQKTITMIHMVGVFYSIRASTNAYQGKVLGFIGDRRATKEPTPVCLPQTKAWQWFSGQAYTNKEGFMTFYKDGDNQNKWWTLGTALTSKVKVPYLLAIPNVVVEVLRESGGAATPADVLGAIDTVNQTMNGEVTEDQWSTVIDWCLLAGQADRNGRKSLLSIELDSVAIDDKEFDSWVGAKLDLALNPRLTKNPQVATVTQPPLQDYLQMSRLLVSTVGQGMMQFSQAVATQASSRGTATLGPANPLETNKGFDRDQISKLKDACGVMAVRNIPNIWYVIQTTKGKA